MGLGGNNKIFPKKYIYIYNIYIFTYTVHYIMYLHLSLFHHYLSINMFFWDANQVDEERKRNALPRNGNLNVGFRRHTCDFSVVPV